MLLFQDHYKFDQRNPRARKLSRCISGQVGSFLKSQQFREKIEREKGKILSGSKKRGHDGKNDDDDEFDGNDDRVYRDSEDKVGYLCFLTPDPGPGPQAQPWAPAKICI